VIKQESGDDGEHAWRIDENGKVLVRRDEQTQKERRLEMLRSEYAYADPNSDIFTVTFDGVDTASGHDCYVLTTSNSINSEVRHEYYDTETFMVIRLIVSSPRGERRTTFFDYRDVSGIPFAFQQYSVDHPSGMRQTTTFTTVERNVAVDASKFNPPGADVEDFTFANGRSAENIPFKYIDDHIYLSLEVGGKTRLWILDTGASSTVIDKTFAEELGLTLEGKIKGQGAGHQVDVSFTTLPAFSLPGLSFEEQRAASIDVGEIFDRWLGMEVAGILGFDFLSRLVTKVDYANETLSFFNPDSFHYEGNGHVFSTPVTQRNMMELPVVIDGEYDGQWSLDLGAGGMTFHYPYAEKHGLLDRPGVERMGRGAGGTHMSRRLMTKTMQLGPFTVHGEEVAVPVEQGQGAFGHTEQTGNIGNTLLRHFVLYIDYKHEQIYVEKGDDFGRAFPRDNSGLQFENIDGQLQVIFVAPGTPAEEAGFKTDDVITSVNNIAVNYLGGVVAVKALLRQPPGTKLAFEVSRDDGASQSLDMTLRDLF
jgi:hypothetical protein